MSVTRRVAAGAFAYTFVFGFHIRQQANTYGKQKNGKKVRVNIEVVAGQTL